MLMLTLLLLLTTNCGIKTYGCVDRQLHALILHEMEMSLKNIPCLYNKIRSRNKFLTVAIRYSRQTYLINVCACI
jgi:hypothetical protein